MRASDAPCEHDPFLLSGLRARLAAGGWSSLVARSSERDAVASEAAAVKRGLVVVARPPRVLFQLLGARARGLGDIKSCFPARARGRSRMRHRDGTVAGRARPGDIRLSSPTSVLRKHPPRSLRVTGVQT